MGRSPRTPKSSIVRTIPSPNRFFQIALHWTRATRGLPGSTSQRARLRRSTTAGRDSETNRAGTAGSTGAPGTRKSPRTWMCVFRRCSPGNSRRMGVSGAARLLRCFRNCVSRSRRDASSGVQLRKYWASRFRCFAVRSASGRSTMPRSSADNDPNLKVGPP